jgi:hypothetical protein
LAADVCHRKVETIDAAGALGAVGGRSKGSLVQLSGILVPDSSPHRPGTYALAGSLDWQDLQISARLRSDDDGALGIMFRYADADRYYRFSMDKAGSYRRLIKKAGGMVTVLWEDAAAYDIGAQYEVTLRAVGSELRGYVNGTLLYAVNDGDVPRGRIGFTAPPMKPLASRTLSSRISPGGAVRGRSTTTAPSPGHRHGRARGDRCVSSRTSKAPTCWPRNRPNLARRPSPAMRTGPTSGWLCIRGRTTRTRWA